MNGVGATTMRRTTSKPLKRRISGAVMTALAVFVTIWPVFITGFWIHATFFDEPRQVVALSALQQPRDVRLFDEPLVSVTFDDSWESIYSAGAPILHKHGIPTTQYVLSGFFDHPQYMSKQQVLSMHRSGHDMQSHTISHHDLKAMDDEQLERELRQSKVDLEKLLGREVTAFASPMSRYNDRTLSRIQAHYYNHRTTNSDLRTIDDEDVNVREKFDPYLITAFSVRSDTTTEEIKDFLAYAKQRKAWAVLVYHEVGETSESIYNVTSRQLDDQMAAVKQSGIKVATMTQVMQDYDSRIRKDN